MKNTTKSAIFWIALIFGLVFFYNLFDESTSTAGANKLIFSEFLDRADSGDIADVVIQGDNIYGHLSDGGKFYTYAANYPNLIDLLQSNNVKIDVQSTETKINPILGALISWFPIILLVGVWIFFLRQMQGGGSKAMGFGKSKAKLLADKGEKVTFLDVAGIDEAKDELLEIVEFLRNPGKFQKLGGKIPRGCLLVGSPGTGKTLLARAIAGEANVPFFSISGSDFVEMFVGVGASRVRDMFEQGKKNAPCIIFIDEIDAVGRHRGVGMGGGNDEREQTLNQLLVEMDGFEANEGVIIIAATNRPDVLDPALLRPGRFDRQIVVPAPDINGREQILNVHLKKVQLAPDVDARVIARGTPGFSGADLANLVNEAALLAARKDKKMVTMRELESAKDKVMMGAERKSLVMSEEEKRLTAYHEGGHAIVTIYTPASDPIHKATIIPRGRALGLVMRLPESDRLSVTRAKLKADLAVAMGGRVAEELIFGYDKVTSGASSDIQMATKIARKMVMQWGLSDAVGTIYYGDEREDSFLGHASGGNGNMSIETSKLIDAEVKKLVDEGYQSAKSLLTEYIEKLHNLANALLEYETLTGDEIKIVMEGNKLEKRNYESDVKSNAKSSFGTKIQEDQ